MQSLRDPGGRLRSFFVSLRYRFRTLGSPAAAFWHSFGVVVSFCCILLFSGSICGGKGSSFWMSSWHRNREKSSKTNKKTRPAQQANRNSISVASLGSPLWCPDSKYHMFCRARPFPFEWLWGRFWLSFGVVFATFAIKGPNLDVTRGTQKAFAKNC